MKFLPEDYFRTATQRIRQANDLYQIGQSYALAIYVAGLSVECMLRAFKCRHKAVFDERHDLLRLLHESGLLKTDWERLHQAGMTDQDIDRHTETLRRSVQQLSQIWHNGYRFTSEEQLEKHLKKTTGLQKIKGSYLKEQARRVVIAAEEIMKLGIVRWQL